MDWHHRCQAGFDRAERLPSREEVALELMAHSILSPLTENAISWVTG
jgi:hypothetical protein